MIGQTVALRHEERAPQDRAVHGDQRDEDAQGAVEAWGEAIDGHLHDLHDRRDRADEDEEGQEGEVDLVAPGQPGERALLQDVRVQVLVERTGDGQHEDDGHAHAERRLDLPGDGQEGAHPQEEGQGHVLNEYGFRRQAEIVLLHGTPPRFVRVSTSARPR